MGRKIQAAPQAQIEQLQNLPPNQQFVELAKLAGFQDWAAVRGVPVAKTNQCLANENSSQPAGPDDQRRDQPISRFPGHADLHPQRQDAREDGDLGDARAAAQARRSASAASGRGGGDRLRIRRLKLSGFKSFVEPAELRIEPGLTGVVGPNGCGKSNLLEAIRWAMGESQPQVAARRRHGRRHLRRHRDAAAARFRRSLDPARARRGRATRTGRRERSHPPDRARRRLGLPDRRPRRPRRRTFRCCSPTPRPAPIRRRWSARARSARSLPPSRSSAGCCSRKRRAFPAFTRGARTPSRSCARPKPISPGSAKSSATRSSARPQLRRQARAAERYRKLTDQIRAAEARLLHARWAEAERAAEAANARSRSGRRGRSRAPGGDRRGAGGAGAAPMRR